MISRKEMQENYLNIENRITEACKRAGRDRSEVTLIAVSKTNPSEAILQAHELGMNVFGENKVQELTGKLQEITEPLSWHLIGHLQRNKVKYIAGKVALIHSVDSLRLAEQINEDYKKIGETAHILIEVNVADEDSKFGVKPENTVELIRQISDLKNVKIEGLMTVAPFTENAEENRVYFKQMKDLSVDIDSLNIDNINMNILSMGMTGDFEIAIEEGANMVRVGTGLFGARHYDVI